MTAIGDCDKIPIPGKKNFAKTLTKSMKKCNINGAPAYGSHVQAELHTIENFVIYRSQKLWLPHDCPYIPMCICMSIHLYVCTSMHPYAHIHQAH